MDNNNNFEKLLKKYTKGEYVTKCNERGITFYYSKNNPEFFIKKLTNKEESKRENIIQLLDHPNIVKYEDSKEIISPDGQSFFYIVTQFVRNSCTIKEKLESTSNFDREEIFKIINQFFDILKNLNESEVLHCDICSDNVMIDSDNNITLIDFGVSMIKKNINLTHTTIYTRKNKPKELNANIDIKDLGDLLEEFIDKLPNNISAENFKHFIKCCQNGTNLKDLKKHKVFYDNSVNTTESQQVVSDKASDPISVQVFTPVSDSISAPVSTPISSQVFILGRPKLTTPNTQMPQHIIEVSPNFYHNNNVSGEYSIFTGTDGLIDLIGQSGSMEQPCPCCGHTNLRTITEGLFKRAIACECKNKTNGFCLCERRSYSHLFFNNDYSQCIDKHHGIYTQQTAKGTVTYKKYRQKWTVTNENQETTELQNEPRIVLKR
ncbi:hypothetical protein DICPUDRAFT_157139 [Dictyostelium purpureum]|uniref:Protein kinase domain-containing protein n=1 Tax=Dictyostelium purpureum TaxID=5786 RepID=F0ZYC8_DICPU|nr:uncharacterized protein DICPUDRAFT_157139 [Dictyostelium purpureum]EGC31055.1 hypothetical protein DICPUDRAFT_157139 [Dictyostelium purpureum]|eukprot:XP_003292414.1 hypothetical protein DICPUDRAFT_157139 [Dictyostelium purpureum]